MRYMISRSVWGLVVWLAFGSGSGSLLALEPATHAHTHATPHSGSGLSLNHGKKWATDAPLRQGMERIRAHMAAALPAIQSKQLSVAGYEQLAGKIRSEVSRLLAECKLEAKADAQLHLLIGGLLEGADGMAGKARQGSRSNAADKVLDTLAQYAAHFDHPGWVALQR